MNDVLFSHMTAAAIAAYIINKLQAAKQLPWITAHSDGINRTLRLVSSFIATAGITYTWDHNAHQLVINGLSLTAILFALYHVFGQYALTHVFGTAFTLAKAQSVPVGVGAAPAVLVTPVQDKPVTTDPKV